MSESNRNFADNLHTRSYVTLMMLLVFVGGMKLVCHGQVLDPAKLMEVRRLVVRFPNDEMPGGTLEQVAAQQKVEAEVEAKRLNDIRTSPVITPYLFELLHEHYNVERDDGTNSILQAIALRNDVQPDQLKVITDEMTSILASPYVRGDGLARGYLYGGITVLASNPSKKNEALVRAVLDRGPDGDVCLGLKIMAIKALSLFGSPENLTRAREVATRLRADMGVGQVYAGYMRELDAAIKAYEHRVFGAASPDTPNSIQAEAGHLQAPNNSSIKAPETTEAPSKSFHVIIVTTIVAAVIGLLLLARKYF